MRRPPPIARLKHYPATGAVGILTILVTLVHWYGHRYGYGIAPLVMNDEALRGEPWRLVTSALPHGGILHIVFNLYWLWVFGTIIEESFGWLRTTGIILLFAVGSAAAEFAVFRGGIGLSGVVYGMFGFLWILGKRDLRFFAVVDRPTIHLFIIWFFVCIVLTVADILRIANVAHGVGWILGMMLAETLARAGKGAGTRKRIFTAALPAVVIATCAIAALARPYINFSIKPGDKEARGAYAALDAGDNERGAALYEESLRLDASRQEWWHNLGVAYVRLERFEEAERAYRRAHELNPGDVTSGRALAGVLEHLAGRALEDGRAADASALYRESIEVDAADAVTWHNLGVAELRLQHIDKAVSAFTKAVELAPRNKDFRAALEAARSAAPSPPAGKKE